MRVDLLSPADAVEVIVDRARRGARGYCCVTNVHQCVLAHDDPGFRALINAADLVIPDSTVLRRSIALRHRRRVPDALRGAELMLELCRSAERDNVPIGLVGGRTLEVLRRLEQSLRERFPSLDIAFSHSPHFRDPSDAERVDLISALRRSRARLVFVGLGCPKQERWMATHTGELDAFLIGVGAAFDFNAGEVTPSPAWVHKAGFEWLYRLAKEPRRLWRRYLTTSPRFLALVLMDGLRNH